MGLLIEPTDMDDDEEQENEKEYERDGEECRVEGRRVSCKHNAVETWMTCARHLEPMSRGDTDMSACKCEKM